MRLLRGEGRLEVSLFIFISEPTATFPRLFPPPSTQADISLFIFHPLDLLSSEKPINSIALYPVSSLTEETLLSMLAAHSPALATLQPYKQLVPAVPGRTPEQCVKKAQLWPVVFVPFRGIQGQKGWTKGRQAWMTEGVKTVIKLALEAGERGEVSPRLHCYRERRR